MWPSWRAGTLRGSFSHWRQWAKAERARASESALAHAEDELRAKVRGQSNHGTACCTSACHLSKVLKHESALVATEAALEREVVHNMECIAYNSMHKTNEAIRNWA